MVRRKQRKKLVRRNPAVVPARLRKAGAMRDKRKGKRAKQAEERRQEEETEE